MPSVRIAEQHDHQDQGEEDAVLAEVADRMWLSRSVNLFSTGFDLAAGRDAVGGLGLEVRHVVVLL